MGRMGGANGVCIASARGRRGRDAGRRTRRTAAPRSTKASKEVVRNTHESLSSKNLRQDKFRGAGAVQLCGVR